MAKRSVSAATTVRAPRSLVTSKNCISTPAHNTFTFQNGVTIEAGQTMVFDLDAWPKHHDLVLLWRDGGNPFVRCCEIAPIRTDDRNQWCMGVLSEDRESIVDIPLGKYERIGVFTGVAPEGRA